MLILGPFFHPSIEKDDENPVLPNKTDEENSSISYELMLSVTIVR